ncbi:GPR1/FUN34/yaaH family-domain-containing protein [Aspergillus aurantiobrunneus]
MSSDITVDKSDETLNRMRTADSVFLPISRETFEKLYLSPKHPSVEGNLRRKLGNPTPICLMGFLIAPMYIFFGGFIQVLGAIGEWIIGNTFTCAIFFTYGTFWLVHGGSLMPFFGTGIHYSPTGNFLEGQETEAYHATQAYYFVFLGLLTFIYLICSIRTNMCLFAALFLLVITFALIAGSFFQMANGATELAHKLQVAAGAFNFALCFPVWHIFLTQILEAVDFPISVPVGDLSSIVPGRSQKVKRSAAA